MLSNILKDESILHGDRLQVVDVKRLSDLHTEIDNFKNCEELNGFQQWIVNDLYSFGIPQADFDIKSILIVAVHHPFYANVELNYNGKNITPGALYVLILRNHVII